MLHIAAATQIRLDTEGRAYHRRKLAAGKTRMEAMRCLKRRISDAAVRQLIADARAAANPTMKRVREGLGATQESSAVDLPPLIDPRISHFPDPRARCAADPATSEGLEEKAHSGGRLTTEGAGMTHLLAACS